jgi:UDP-N-acetylmuramyl pentapeptide phosphotransferase/UDP-N-acetylglucosamine-1-phosphate transferase
MRTIVLLLRLGAAPMDKPNSRSLHDRPIPRIGGLAILIGAGSGWLMGPIGKVWRAHREHYYQRLVRISWGHKGTALFAYILMLVGAAAALVTREQSARMQCAVLAVLACGYLAAMAAFDAQWKKGGLPQ